MTNEFVTTETKFTIHFATINTSFFQILFTILFTFTIHFATINTFVDDLISLFKLLFTIHFATINTN